MPYSSRRWPTISRVLMPRAYIETILSSPGSGFARPRTGSAGEPSLVLGDQLRVEGRPPVARHLQLDLAGVGDDALAAVAVARVAGATVAGEVVVHLGVQRPLGQRLLQAVEEAVRVEGRLRIGTRQQLVEDRVRNTGLFASRHVGAPSLPSCPPTHEIPGRSPAGRVAPATSAPFSFGPGARRGTTARRRRPPSLP